MGLRGAALPTAALALACLAIAGCGGSSAHSAHAKAASAPSSGAKQAFATHAGLAFGAFYHFIYAPYTAGVFRTASLDHAAVARATVAATYIAGQVDQATAAARSSASLARVLAPLELLDKGFHVALVRLREGKLKLSQIQVANLAISAIKGYASNAGAPIIESTPSSV